MTDAPAPFIQTYFMGPHVEYFANRFKTSCVCPCPNSESIWMEPGFQLCQWKDRPRDSDYERCAVIVIFCFANKRINALKNEKCTQSIYVNNVAKLQKIRYHCLA